MNLRFAEMPALFWVMLAGRESRERLRFVLASRKLARRERFRERVAAAADQIMEAKAAEMAALVPSLLRHSGEYAAAGVALADGVAAALRRADDAGLGAQFRRDLWSMPPHEDGPPDGLRYECACAAGAFETLVTEIRRKKRGQTYRWQWCCQTCGYAGWEERLYDHVAQLAVLKAADAHACSEGVRRIVIAPS